MLDRILYTFWIIVIIVFKTFTFKLLLMNLPKEKYMEFWSEVLV